jgi:hypothetical protein
VLAKKLVRDRVEVPVRERRGRSKRIHLHCRPPAREILKPILVVSSSERGLHKYKRVRITGGHSGIILDETVNKLHNKMIKALSSIFIQMRSGKIRQTWPWVQVEPLGTIFFCPGYHLGNFC